MSSTTTTNSLALHEIVLSIADSLNEAQETLRNVSPYDEYGRPNTLYQLPYLDFNLEVISQFETSQTGSSTGGNGIRFIPFRSTETTTKNQGVITSNISGRFVAVMPNEGLPQVLLQGSATLSEVNPLYAVYTLTIKAVQPSNEIIPGQRVEINFDAQTSYDINAKNAVTTPVFYGSKDGYTSADNGLFQVKVGVKIEDYNAGKILIFKANSGTQFTSIAISKS